MAIAQKLLKLVEQEPFYYENQKINITISIGIVHYSGDYKDFDHMMKVADRALFELPTTKVTGFGERRKAHTTFSCFTGYRLVFKETQV